MQPFSISKFAVLSMHIVTVVPLFGIIHPLFTPSSPWKYQLKPWDNGIIQYTNYGHCDVAFVSRRFILPANRLSGQHLVHSDKKQQHQRSVLKALYGEVCASERRILQRPSNVESLSMPWRHHQMEIRIDKTNQTKWRSKPTLDM